MAVDSPQISIQATRLTKKFGRNFAVKDLCFEVKRGEIVGFLGPNGAGKSTTLRIITGLLAATSGHLEVCGLPVSHFPERVRSRIGYMPENNPLPEDMRVIEYLRLRARLKGIPIRRRKALIERALEICELHRKARRNIIGTLSKGFRQRVGIADAILAEPEITILDEPSIGLDPHQVLAMRRLLDQLRGETTVIFSSHILSEVEITCDRVLILNGGHLVAQGTADDLRQEFLPGWRYRAELVGQRDSVHRFMESLEAPWKYVLEPDTHAGYQAVTFLNPESDQGAPHLLGRMTREPAFKVRSFGPVQPSLEDVFLTATRRGWEIDSPTPDTRETANGGAA